MKHHELHHISWKDVSVGSVRVTHTFRMYLPKSIRICPGLCYKYVEDRNSSILGDCYLVSAVPTHSRVTQYTALGHTVGTQYTTLAHTVGSALGHTARTALGHTAGTQYAALGHSTQYWDTPWGHTVQDRKSVV